MVISSMRLPLTFPGSSSFCCPPSWWAIGCRKPPSVLNCRTAAHATQCRQVGCIHLRHADAARPLLQAREPKPTNTVPLSSLPAPSTHLAVLLHEPQLLVCLPRQHHCVLQHLLKRGRDPHMLRRLRQRVHDRLYRVALCSHAQQDSTATTGRMAPPQGKVVPFSALLEMGVTVAVTSAPCSFAQVAAEDAGGRLVCVWHTTSCHVPAKPDAAMSPGLLKMPTLRGVQLEAFCCVALRLLLCCLQVCGDDVCPGSIQLAARHTRNTQHREAKTKDKRATGLVACCVPAAQS